MAQKGATAVVARITITARGDSEDSLAKAVDEAMRRIRRGCTSGMDRNDEGGFYFDVTDDIPVGDYPA